MATVAAARPSTRFLPLQTLAARCTRARFALEHGLEAERDQLPLWLPVALGGGIALWFVLDDPMQWIAAMLAQAGIVLAAIAIGQGGRASRAVALAAGLAALGLGLAWWRASYVAQPVLVRPAIVMLTARVESVEPLPARELVRVRLTPIAAQAVASPPRSKCGKEGGLPYGRGGRGCDDRPRPPLVLPPHVRVNIADTDVPAGLGPGAVIKLQTRLMPPNEATVPGAYDFRQVAWFDGLGATGRGNAPVKVIEPGRGSNGLRAALAAHIQSKVEGSAGGIAAALAAGDEGAISLEDADAMRRSGLAHLLSVSGLHITAVVVATIWAVTRLLALWPWLALRVRIPVVAAGAGAIAAIGYTLLTGSQVPTARSCIAALLVLAALAMGREAITLRLVAAGAFIVLLIWPEALAGPSFQLSFAAVGSLIAFHEQPRIKRLFEKRDEAWWRRVAREIGSLLLTGLVVEAALAPIALYHFHKEGMYGVVANIVAIPLTTFVIMPAEALALAGDAIGLGAPFWWVTTHALNLLLWIARTASKAPGSVAMLPGMPPGAFGLMILGLLWLMLWRSRMRFAGLVPMAMGAIWALAIPAPDLLISGDGQHLAVRTPDGGVAILRDKAGDYTRDTMTQNAGVDGEALLLSDQPFAKCTPDACLALVQSGGRIFRVLATRSLYQLPSDQLIAACRAVDIVVSDRRLPSACRPIWLKLDAPFLRRTGGMAISLASGRIVTVRQPGDRHPWVISGPRLNRIGATGRRGGPGSAPAEERNAADRKRDWPDRAAP
ncbi:ComEC/Rec2 family competence protein [Sphingomonas asaccharolytica]|uniref:ComEC/Rec2 family competence protein n=1 Tax=Sphingomonas asaccharolytica TaxID=40681 RepID=UPI0009FFA69E|nr:ComEC/Rec2 family competence protein [Sphingomonas asaccharolytica]